jgi:hypothetical protein
MYPVLLLLLLLEYSLPRGIIRKAPSKSCQLSDLGNGRGETSHASCMGGGGIHPERRRSRELSRTEMSERCPGIYARRLGKE